MEPINSIRLAVALSFFFILQTAAFSKDASNDTISLDEIVITGSKQFRSAGNVTQKIDVILNNEFESAVTGNRNIAEVIARKPGASVSALSRNDANWGTYAGIGPKYSTFMLNGLPLDAFIDPMSLDLLAIERIEIQRGPASVLYPNYLSQDFAGNQSPLAGTVNLILKENISHRETQLVTSYGSYNTLNTQAYHQDARENMNFFAGVNFENSDYTNYGTDGSWLNMQKDPEYQKLKMYSGVNFFYGSSNRNRLSAFLNKTIHKGDAGRIYRGYRHDYTTLNISQVSEINESLIFNASAGMRIYDRTWQESNFNLIDSLRSNDGVFQNIIPVDASLSWKHGEGHLLTIGADYQNAHYHTFSDPLAGYRLEGSRSRAFQTGIYLQEEMNFGGLTTRGGLRYNYIRTTIDLISSGNAGEPVTSYNNLLWSAGMKYNVSRTVSVFANAGNSFLPPGLRSMGGTIKLVDRGVPGRHGQLPNPGLKPESGMGADAGAGIRLNANLDFALRGFYMNVTDAIVENIVSADPSQTQSVNAGNTTSRGFEIEVGQALNPSFSWFANYTYMKTAVKNEMDADQDGATVPFAPSNILNAGISISTAFGLKVNPVLNYNGGYYDSSSLSGRNVFTPGALINLLVSQLVAVKEDYNLDIFISAYNLTNNKFEMPWQFQNTGLAITGGFKMSFR
jgi:iron complex outermembrane recepter protein